MMQHFIHSVNSVKSFLSKKFPLATYYSVYYVYLYADPRASFSISKLCWNTLTRLECVGT